jgi:hypothetical protein
MKTLRGDRVAGPHRPVAGVLAAAVAFALLVVAAAPVRAQQQDQQTDPGWQAYLGCWQPISGPQQPPGDTSQVPLVCVIPAPSSVGVDVATVSGGQIVSRQLVEATGEHRAVNRDGCTGWESAAFSSLGSRVYLTAEYTCPGNIKRTTSELMALTPDLEWIDVKGAAVRGIPVGVRVLRYRPAEKGADVPSDLAWAVEGEGMATATARQAAAQPIIVDDVVEAVHHVEPAVVEAWLVEEHQGFALTGRQLLALKHEGVPARVLDVMVAASYPSVFAFNVATNRPERRAPQPLTPDESYGRRPAYGWGTGSPFGCFSPFAWNCYSPYGWGYYSPYFMSSPYGYYSPYGYWGGYGYYPAGGVVVVSGGGGQAARHGRMVVGSGYTQGGAAGGATVGTAHPSERSPGTGQVYRSRGQSGASSPPPSPPPSSKPAPAPSSGSSGRSSGTPTGRTAHPRP